MTPRRLFACLLCLAACGPVARAETRQFHVTVDGKDAGSYTLTVQHDQGTSTVTGQANIKVRVLVVSYTYAYNGREVWKDGRLQSLDSQTNDDGKRFTVAARAEGTGLRVTANGQPRATRGDVWTTSYWRLAPAQF